MDQRKSKEDQVRMRAYELFEKRKGTHGTAMEDWLKAEKEITISPKENRTEQSPKRISPGTH